MADLEALVYGIVETCLAARALDFLVASRRVSLSCLHLAMATKTVELRFVGNKFGDLRNTDGCLSVTNHKRKDTVDSKDR